MGKIEPIRLVKTEKVIASRKQLIIKLLKQMLKGTINELYPVFNQESDIGFSIPEATKILKTKPSEAFEILDKLVERGALIKEIVKTVEVCPFCKSYHLRIRTTCPDCKSENLTKSNLLHHYKCGYVEPEDNFRQGHHLICPKCNKVLKHFGVDYEKLSNVFICLNCNKSISSPTNEYECLVCEKSFNKDNSVMIKIGKYSLSANAYELINNDNLLLPERRSDIDNLTGVYNNSHFAEIVQREERRITRYGGNACLIKVEIANFLIYQNQYGQQKYISLLSELAQILKENLRDVDYLARIDENTFEALLVETKLKEAMIVEKKIKATLNKTFSKLKTEVKLTFKISTGNLGSNISSER